jgi:hypothetical protein
MLGAATHRVDYLRGNEYGATNTGLQRGRDRVHAAAPRTDDKIDPQNHSEPDSPSSKNLCVIEALLAVADRQRTGPLRRPPSTGLVLRLRKLDFVADFHLLA